MKRTLALALLLLTLLGSGCATSSHPPQSRDYDMPIFATGQ